MGSLRGSQRRMGSEHILLVLMLLVLLVLVLLLLLLLMMQNGRLNLFLVVGVRGCIADRIRNGRRDSLQVFRFSCPNFLQTHILWGVHNFRGSARCCDHRRCLWWL